MIAEELLEVCDHGRVRRLHRFTDLPAQRIVVRGIDFRIVSGRIDSGHHSEQRRAEIKLAALGGCRAIAEHKNEEGWNQESTQTLALNAPSVAYFETRRLRPPAVAVSPASPSPDSCRQHPRAPRVWAAYTSREIQFNPR